LVLVAFGIGVTVTGAQSLSWTNTASGNWSIPGSWSPNSVPGVGTNAFLTNNTGSASYTVTNDVPNNTFGDLTIFNPSTGIHTLLSELNGFNPAGNVIIGQRGTLTISGSSAIIGGSLTTSNNLSNFRVLDGGSAVVGGLFDNGGNVLVGGSAASTLSITGGALNRLVITISSNSVLNVGGTDEASANASSSVFTNLAGATVLFSGQLASLNTLNARTTGIGFVNQGTINNYHDTGGVALTNVLNAAVFNDTTGLIQFGSSRAIRMTLDSLRTNQGNVVVNFQNNTLEVRQGDIYNSGTIEVNQGVFDAPNSVLTIASSGTLLLQGAGRPDVYASSFLNQGTLIVSNSGIASTGLVLGRSVSDPDGIITNRGEFRIYRPLAPSSFFRETFISGIIINEGTMNAIGSYDVLVTNAQTLNYTLAAVTNQVNGTIISSNGAAFALFTLQNKGTIRVETNSLFAVGAVNATLSSGPGRVDAGTLTFTNDGAVIVNGGTFAVAGLYNNSDASVEGQGEIGRSAQSNLVSASTLTTNYIRHFFTRNVINEGTIAPDGILNVGAITNLSGGQIIGTGTIQSLDTTNSYSGETLVTTTYNTGARILNNTGASILASGGMLVLSNGLVDNSNAGTLGATNGGILQLGDGTLALTNNGTISVHNGGLNIGAMRNNGTIQIVGSSVTFSNSVVNAGRYISDPSTNTFVSDLTLTPSGTLEGGIGDLFDFKKNLFINSTNTMQFNLVLSTVSFTGGGDHTNAITGLDLGGIPLGESLGFQSTNFAYGTLKLGSTDNLFVTDADGDPATTNGLYIGILDIGGTTSDLDRLHSSLNIYYREGLAENDYLGGLTYQLDGDGFLIPVPEPSSLLLLLVASAAFVLRRRRV